MAYNSKAEATTAAKKCLTYFPKRKGWKIRVWSRIGWHYEVFNGRIHVYESTYRKMPPTYFCLIADNDDMPGGSGYWSWRKNGPIYRNPVDAVKGEMEKVRAFLNRMAALTQDMEEHFVKVGVV